MISLGAASDTPSFTDWLSAQDASVQAEFYAAQAANPGSAYTLPVAAGSVQGALNWASANSALIVAGVAVLGLLFSGGRRR